MRKNYIIMLMSLCIVFLPCTTVHANINDLIYVLFVKAPATVYVPTFEFEAGNSLKVIGASYEYGQLQGRWQEVDFALFSFFQAQVEKSEPTTTTTIPDIPSVQTNTIPLLPAESEKTKYLINLAGLAFPSLPLLPSISMMVGTGAYLGADAVFVGFSTLPDAAVFGSIVPPIGIREITIPDVTVTCRNTTFNDGNPVKVEFSPSDGLTVSSLSVRSDTEVRFNLQIAVDAPVGKKSVIVTYGSPTKSVIGNAVFEIIDASSLLDD